MLQADALTSSQITTLAQVLNESLKEFAPNSNQSSLDMKNVILQYVMDILENLIVSGNFSSLFIATKGRSTERIIFIYRDFLQSICIRVNAGAFNLLSGSSIRSVKEQGNG